MKQLLKIIGLCLVVSGMVTFIHIHIPVSIFINFSPTIEIFPWK